ncbi:MAG: small multi-drug export protein [Hadesarchaea archaeon]|nr:small multi-drug export protein [Hadesarchaea archaeon]
MPAFESRYAIPIALALTRANPAFVFAVCVALNILAVPIVFLGLDLLTPVLRRYKWVNSIFAWFLDRGRKLRRWGPAWLAIFVMIPIPVTGAYTGALIAYLLNMDRKYATLAIAVGVITAGAIITLATLGILSLAKLLS